MKILLIRSCPGKMDLNGYNCQQVGLAKALIKKGNVCDLVLHSQDNEYSENDYPFKDGAIHIYYVPGRVIRGKLFFDKKIKDIISKYDIVQAEEYHQVGNIKLKKYAKNKMVIYHGPYFSEISNRYRDVNVIYTFFPKYKKTKCIAKSELAKDFLNIKGFNNVKTIGVGLDIEKLEDNSTEIDMVKKLKVEKEKGNLKYLLYVGKIEERRDTLFLLKLFSNIVKKDDKVKLILIGKGEKEYFDKCQELIDKENIRDNIIYIESVKQSEIKYFYEVSDIFLLPTKFEIYGMVIMEAMYYKKPVITTLNGGSSLLIKNNYNGFICEQNNIEQWTNTILDVLKDNSKKAEIGEHAHNTIIENFTWDSLADSFIEVYNSVINGEKE